LTGCLHKSLTRTIVVKKHSFLKIKLIKLIPFEFMFEKRDSLPWLDVDVADASPCDAFEPRRSKTLGFLLDESPRLFLLEDMLARLIMH